MKLCIPAADDKGLEAKTFAHFGSAPFYAIADTDTDQVEMIENKHHEQGHGGCGQVGRLRSRGIDALVCRDSGDAPTRCSMNWGSTCIPRTDRPSATWSQSGARANSNAPR